VRFGLTSEAGLNDGFAFPFVHLAIALGTAALSDEAWLGKWLGISVIWEIAAGIGGGWLVGRLFGWLTFRIPADKQLARTGDGMIAVAATFVSSWPSSSRRSRCALLNATMSSMSRCTISPSRSSGSR
jgi:sodium/hydrogen antiporter